MTTSAVCISQGQYQEGLIHFKHALQIQQQYFLPNYPSLAQTYNSVASAYYKQDQFKEALPYYMKALAIEQSSLSNDHPHWIRVHQLDNLSILFS